MEYFDLWDSFMIKSLRLPKSVVDSFLPALRASATSFYFLGDIEFHNRNQQHLANDVVHVQLFLDQGFAEDFLISENSKFIQLLIVPTFLKELIYKVLGLQVSLLELDRFGILLGEREEGQDMRLSRVLLWSPRIIKVSPLIGMWMTFSTFLVTDNSGMILGQPIHTNDDVKTTEFNQHEIDFERLI
ncbi:hypothetical protein Tco_1145827 [Tanacetum coccineum]